MPNSYFQLGEKTPLEVSVHPQLREENTVTASVCFKVDSLGDPGEELPLQLSRAGLLGPTGAPGKRAALQRDSSAHEQLLCTAQPGWGHCLQGTRAAERREGDVKGSVEWGC